MTTEPTPILVHRAGADRAIVVGPADAVAALGQREGDIPANVMRAIRSAAVATPAFTATADQLAGGLVRLNARSQALLAQHGPVLADGGGVLGVVQGADGKFAGVLAFEDAGLANMGVQLPALFAAAALQLQLAIIERQLDEIQASIDALVRDGQIEVLAEARASLTILRDVYRDATETGELSDDDWARAVALELPVRRLHEQSSAQLRRIDEVLSNPDAGVAQRLRALNDAVRGDRARFWFETYVVAEASLARWEAVRLIRLSVTDDPRLWRELGESRDALETRHEFLRSLTAHLAGYLSDAGRVDGLLDRLRIFSRARLDRLIVEMDQVLAIYDKWVPSDGLSAQTSLGSEGEEGLPEPVADFSWSELASRARERSGAIAERTGAIAADTASTIRRSTSRALRASRDFVRRDSAGKDQNESV